ncbi:Ropporin-1-like protein [Anthophora plagiata]
MSFTIEDIYCVEQIQIPPSFPHILKLYAKAAIRTQPYDLLQWTSAYFRALASGDVPPVKERLEYPPFSHPSGITPGYLKTLLKVFGHVEKIPVESLLESWQGIAMPETTLFRILMLGKCMTERELHFYKFLAMACGFLGKEEDTATTTEVCQITPRESRSSEPLRVVQDHRADTRHSEVDEVLHDQLEHSTLGEEEIKDRSKSVEEHGKDQIESQDQMDQDQTDQEKRTHSDVQSHRTTIPDFHFLDKDSDTSKDDDLYSYYEGEESEKEAIIEPMDDYEPIGLETILHGICECLEPVREVERVPTPPPPDPFEEFLKRMKLEIDEGRLETRFRVEGVGPRVSENRVTSVAVWMVDCARRQEGMVGPRNIRHFLCPDLEDPRDNNVAN